MTLRPYQSAIIAETRQYMAAGQRSVLITSPTGSGKTMLTAHMMREAAAKGKRCWFVVHRRELVKQSLAAFHKVGVSAGVIASGWMAESRALVQVASIGTLARRLQDHASPDLVVWDECHHAAAKSWADVRAKAPLAFHVGLSATPERLDGKGLKDYFSRIVHGPSVSDLIDQGYLSTYRIFSPPGIDTRGLRSMGGDYNRKQLGIVSDRPTITGDAVRHYQRLAPGKRAVVFAVNVEHSQHIVAQFNAAGIDAAHIDGETDNAQRDHVLDRFQAGAIKVVSNVELLGEGFDCPGIEVAILLRPTQSLGLYLQQVGRALRLADGKSEAIILDHAGNAGRHGLPDDARQWRLEGRPAGSKSKQEQEVHVRICPKCFGAQAPGRQICAYCGTPLKPTPRELEVIAGELAEIERVRVQTEQRKEIGRARTLEQLEAIGKERGYHSGWARKVYYSRRHG